MNKDQFIGLIRLSKKVFNTQQEALGNGQGYLGMLAHTAAITVKLDIQLKAVPKNCEVYYDWMPKMLWYLREWRREQNMYKEHVVESRLHAARAMETKLEQAYQMINKFYPEVLSNPTNVQTSLL